MMGSTLVDYICGLVIARGFGDVEPAEVIGRTRGQRIALFVSVLTNLSLLAFFKYFNFATENYDAVLSSLGLEDARLDLWYQITLPLGISFYTFQSMSYSIDVFRGEARAVRNFIDFACYVSMFPQLVAGPIIRFRECAHQLLNRVHTTEKFARGVTFFAHGLAKKVLLANPCGSVADTAFDAASVGIVDAWTGVIAYAFQIYFDFSGYSDMAIGLSLMFGFVFPKNFDSPYHADSITDFWRRWHLSLSTWLRDYLYIPLGGNRVAGLRTYFNLAAVMLLGGLWHGSSWNFVIWGAIHGAVLAIERMMGRDSLYRRLPRFFRVVITFVIVLISWVFFRAADLSDALAFCKGMIGLSETTPEGTTVDGLIYRPYYMGAMAIAALVIWVCPQTWDFTRRISWPKILVAAALLVLAIAALMTQSHNPFIYFIF
jgi:alginate O-acetyltransferase complex protein AlgI